jgi:hypothetical protein
MTIARDLIVDSFSQPRETPKALASWYAQGLSDGLGDRLLMFDNTGGSALELLRFRREFAASAGFESALRERMEQLAQFTHPVFSTVRAVEDLGPGDGLALVSTYVPGRRLSEALGQVRSAAFAMRLIRQLTPGLAALQQQGEGIVHGALAAERIVVTADGQLKIREHVLGSAIERLGLPATRLWTDVGILVAPIDTALPRLDGRTDVVQLALIALSLMLGRRVGPGEYPKNVQALLDQVAETAGRRSQPLLPPLRYWLERALQVNGRAFESARDAHHGLGDLYDETQGLEAHRGVLASHAQSSPGTESASEALQSHASLRQPRQDLPLLTVARVGPPAAIMAFSEESPPAASAPGVLAEAHDGWEDTRTEFLGPLRSSEWQTRTVGATDAGIAQERPPAVAAAVPSRVTGACEDGPSASSRYIDAPSRPMLDLQFDRQWERREALARDPDEASVGAFPRWAAKAAPLRWVTALTVALAIGEAIAINRLLHDRASTPLANAAVMVETPRPGADVLVDGRLAGVTPLELKVGGRTRSISVVSHDASTATDLIADDTKAERPSGPPVAQTAEVHGTADIRQPAAGPQRSGGIRLSSPIELHVLEDERLLGSSADGPIVATAGRHEFLLVNSVFGYRARRVVDVKPGRIVALAVTLPDGSVSINAVPWAAVWIDGNAVGETPLANLPVPVGEHDVVFRHPELGERSQKVIVRSDGPTRVSANLR